MIKKLRLKCHSLTSSTLGYTLPVDVGNKETNNEPSSAGPSTRNHSSIEPQLNGVIREDETSSQVVGYYDPLPGKTKLKEEGATLRIQGSTRMQGTTRLCYSDDDTDLNESPPNLSQAMKSISLNEESSTFCCTTQHVDSFSGEEGGEEETHMSWIEIMAKKRELERSLKSRNNVEAHDFNDIVLNSCFTQDGIRKSKKSSFFSPSFKFRDLFPTTNNTVKQKKPRKAKARSNHLGLCSTLRGQSSTMRRSSGSSNDPSPVLFDLRSRDLPAIPVQDADDGVARLRGNNSWDRESRYNRTSSNSSSGSGDVFIDSFNELKNKGWYWGPLSWKEAEDQLRDKPTGSFLVRDSSDDRYILSLTFKSEGRIHHTRIEHYRGQFSFNNQPKSLGAATIVEFIEKAIENCADGSFSYFLRPRGPGVPPTMFRLVRPVSRFTRVHSLQHLCRFVILSKIRRDMIDQLPVPLLIKRYLACTQYYIE